MSKKVFGPPPPSERCVYKMWHRSYPRQCSNRGRFSEEGRLWCKIHAPSERQKRTDVAVAAYREKSSLAAERFLRSAACVSALDGLEPAGVAPLIKVVKLALANAEGRGGILMTWDDFLEPCRDALDALGVPRG